MKKKLLVIIVLIVDLSTVYGQNEADTLSSPPDSISLDKPKFQQQPGLALAASKIFFSDKRWSVSGFGEYNYVPVQKGITTSTGDLELYYSGLYRQAIFFGYRLSDKWVWNSELQVEFLHFKNQESHQELVVEAFVDYLFKDYLKARIGFYPLTIGYVNNNDEPVMFYSVNRSEVERLITPSTWIEFGTMLYGNFSKDWGYALGFSQGLNSKNYLSGSWIRQGREIRFGVPKSISINPQINFYGVKDLTLSASGYYGNSGQQNYVEEENGLAEVKAKISLTTAYAKYDWRNFRLVTVGTYGSLGDTEKIYELTKEESGANGQVLGKQTYGYLCEIGCDILPYFRRENGGRLQRKTFFYDNRELKISLFSRYERLNTHQKIHQELVGLPRNEGNLKILTIGANLNTKENVVIKANYQRRKNRSEFDPSPLKHIVETGLGFIF